MKDLIVPFCIVMLCNNSVPEFHEREKVEMELFHNINSKAKPLTPIADLTRETGIQYRMLKQWFEDYQKCGEDGLSTRKRGRPRKPQPNTPEEKIRQLEMENEVLRAFLEEYERWDAKNSGTK